MTAPPALLPLLKADFVEPDIKVGDIVAPRTDTKIEIYVIQVHRADRVYVQPRDAIVGVRAINSRGLPRGLRFRRDDLVLLEPRWPGEKVQAWITERLIKRRGRR